MPPVKKISRKRRRVLVVAAAGLLLGAGWSLEKVLNDAHPAERLLEDGLDAAGRIWFARARPYLRWIEEKGAHSISGPMHPVFAGMRSALVDLSREYAVEDLWLRPDSPEEAWGPVLSGAGVALLGAYEIHALTPLHEPAPEAWLGWIRLETWGDEPDCALIHVGLTGDGWRIDWLPIFRREGEEGLGVPEDLRDLGRWRLGDLREPDLGPDWTLFRDRVWTALPSPPETWAREHRPEGAEPKGPGLDPEEVLARLLADGALEVTTGKVWTETWEDLQIQARLSSEAPPIPPVDLVFRYDGWRWHPAPGEAPESLPAGGDCE